MPTCLCVVGMLFLAVGGTGERGFEMPLHYGILIGVNVYWGLTQVLIKHALLYMSSGTYTALRFGTAALVLVAICLVRRERIDRRTLLHGVVLGTLVAGQTLLNSFALYFTSTANSVFIAQLSIVVVPLYYLIRNRKAPSRAYLVAVVSMVVGLMIFANVFKGSFNLGDMVVVLSMLTICGQIIYGARVTAHDDLFQLAVVQMVSAAAVSIVAALPQGGFTVAWTPESVAIILLTGVIGSGVCNSLRLVAQKHLAPIVISFINILHPIFAMVGAAVIPNALGEVEPIIGYKVVGAAIMIAGMVFYLLRGKNGPESGVIAQDCETPERMADSAAR